jgi:hypothetical protein
MMLSRVLGLVATVIFTVTCTSAAVVPKQGKADVSKHGKADNLVAIAHELDFVTIQNIRVR